jgi:hypothetical protein
LRGNENWTLSGSDLKWTWIVVLKPNASWEKHFQITFFRSDL